MASLPPPLQPLKPPPLRVTPSRRLAACQAAVRLQVGLASHCHTSPRLASQALLRCGRGLASMISLRVTSLSHLGFASTSPASSLSQVGQRAKPPPQHLKLFLLPLVRPALPDPWLCSEPPASPRERQLANHRRSFTSESPSCHGSPLPSRHRRSQTADADSPPSRLLHSPLPTSPPSRPANPLHVKSLPSQPRLESLTFGSNLAPARSSCHGSDLPLSG